MVAAREPASKRLTTTQSQESASVVWTAAEHLSLPSGQIKCQLFCKFLGKWHAGRDFLASPFIELKLLSHSDLKPPFAITNDSEHFLVGATGDEWLINANRHPAYLGLAADPVQATSLLLQRACFRERGPRAMWEPVPMPEIGKPVQLIYGVSVVLAYYRLGHTVAVSTVDTDRIAVYFRIWLLGVEFDRFYYLTNIWDGWKL